MYLSDLQVKARKVNTIDKNKGNGILQARLGSCFCIVKQVYVWRCRQAVARPPPVSIQ